MKDDFYKYKQEKLKDPGLKRVYDFERGKLEATVQIIELIEWEILEKGKSIEALSQESYYSRESYYLDPHGIQKTMKTHGLKSGKRELESLLTKIGEIK